MQLGDRISERAHQLWEEAGRPEGQSDHFWLAAEREAKAAEAGADEALADSFPASDPPANTGITGPETGTEISTGPIAAAPVTTPAKPKSPKPKSTKAKAGSAAKTPAVRSGDRNDAPASWN